MSAMNVAKPSVTAQDLASEVPYLNEMLPVQ